MPKSPVGEWATKDKGRTKKSWKASPGKPYFFGRAKHILGMWTEPTIFAWIIIQNRRQNWKMALETVGKGMQIETATWYFLCLTLKVLVCRGSKGEKCVLSLTYLGDRK